MTNLFNDFDHLNKNEWLNEIEKSLKGKSLDTLNKLNFEGVNTELFYNEDISTDDVSIEKVDNNWLITENISITDEKQANQKALFALTNGVQAIRFIANTDAKINFDLLLKGILLDIAPVYFIGGTEENNALFNNYLKGKALESSGAYVDPIGLACTGNLNEELHLTNWITKGNGLIISGEHYDNAGADIPQSISYTLGHLVEYLEVLKTKTFDTIHLKVRAGIGSNFFLEIARGRALRKLVEKVISHYDFKNKLNIHFEATNKWNNKSIFDAHNNILRTTTETLSAAISGYDNIQINPFDAHFKTPDNLSERIARNIHHLLKEESYIHQVIDAAHGSFYVEKITQQLMDEAWSLFQEMETNGGLIKLLKEGKIQKDLNARMEQLMDAANQKKLRFIGVNQFPNLNENPTENIAFIQPFCIGDGEKHTGIAPLNRKRILETIERERLSELKAVIS